MSPKSMQFLNNASDTLEMNNVHVLNWGSTRMAGFLDACIQASSIIVPFLDTIVTGNIREEEMMFVASPNRVFLLQIYADLHPVFAGKYLRYIDKDDILVCEVYSVAPNNATLLSDANFKSPLADNFLESLHVDPYNNIKVVIDSSLAALMARSNNDLASGDENEPKVQKIEALCDINALDTRHILEDWFNFKVKATYQDRLICQKESLSKNSR